MQDPEVFYNKEDLWNFPRESHKGQNAAMQPYYTIMNYGSVEYGRRVRRRVDEGLDDARTV